MSDCPFCEQRPRRRPGAPCSLCENDRRSANRWGRKLPRKSRKGERPARFDRSLQRERPVLITAAQNATPVHAGALAAMKVAAAALDAELVVIPLRYRNPTSLWSREQETDEWWDDAVVPYLLNVRKKLGPNLVLAADVKTQPTASSPLSGFESLTGAESCIIGHPKMQLRTVAVPSGRTPKILSTTGVVTQRNYTDTKAGKIGEFHHYLGGLLIERKGKKFHLRQLNCDRETGAFIDLDKLYTAQGVEQAPPALALIMGDTHVPVTDPDVDRATFGPEGIVETLNPERLIFHDVFDGESVNPHDVGDPFIAEAKRKEGRLDVRAELQQMVDFVNERAGDREVVLVDSNHHTFLVRWLRRVDWRQDLKNAEFYLETALATLRSARMGPGGAEYDDPFHYWVKKLGARSNIRCLKPDESYVVGCSECGMHGHNGPSGARGSIKNLSQLGCRTCTGHGHAPGIEGGHYRGGSSTGRQAYQRGPGADLNTHIVIYANEKRALINIFGGEWRA
jgi:hypothetical protein